MKNFFVNLGLFVFFWGGAAIAEEGNSKASKLTQDEMDRLFGTKVYTIIKLSYDQNSLAVVEPAIPISFDDMSRCESELLAFLILLTDEKNSYQVATNTQDRLVLNWNGKDEVFFLCVGFGKRQDQ
ncbi:hypothetical protein [Rhodosalinus sediminis]|uniref:hypothetical protein n=1 Tax=Rhodosalinus sediminis TaxID=1940533 RepID=UPI0011C05F02|nr:hypothetical protein [Rhodosalinus sediminis]